jgi:hypothetical protein
LEEINSKISGSLLAPTQRRAVDAQVAVVTAVGAVGREAFCTDQIRVETDQEKRKSLCSEVQKILADDLPYIPMWFTDVVSVHSRELGDLQLSPTGDYDFLTILKPSPN